MKELAVTSTRKSAKCEICRVVRQSEAIDVFTGNKFPPEVNRLERCEALLCCPLCGAFYLEVYEKAVDHYMSVFVWIEPISEQAALRELGTQFTMKAKRWLGKFDIAANLRVLVPRLEKAAEAKEAAEALTGIYYYCKDWNGLEGLLRHANAAVRGAALRPVNLSCQLDRMPPGIADAVAALFADEPNARSAYVAFIIARGMRGVSPLITALIGCLDHADIKARYTAAKAIRYFLARKIEYDTKGQPIEIDEKAPKFGRLAKSLYPLVPLIVRHIIAPQPVSKKRNTGPLAKKILTMLCRESKSSKAKVRKAIGPAVPAELRTLFPKG